MTTSMAAIPLTSFQDIRAQWLELLSRCSVNTFYLMPQWQEVWWDSFREGREMAGFYLKDGIRRCCREQCRGPGLPSPP